MGMNIGSVLDRELDSELDARFIAQLAAVGSLADEVVGDLIEAQAGLKLTTNSDAIRRAADLFGLAASMAEEPSDPWVRNRLSDAIRRMADGHAADRSVAVSGRNDSKTWITSLAHDLRSAAESPAPEDSVKALLSQFEDIADGTMAAASESIRMHGSMLWLTT